MLLKELQKHCDVILRHRVESHVSTIMVEHSEIIRLGEVDTISARRSHIHPDLAEIFTHTYNNYCFYSCFSRDSELAVSALASKYCNLLAYETELLFYVCMYVCMW